MSTELSPFINASLEQKVAYVKTLARAGELLPKGLWENARNEDTGLMEQRPSPGKVLLVAETGAMLGIHPMAALQGIDVIEGHPTIKPSLMSALIRKAGHTLRVSVTGSIEHGDIEAVATLTRKDDPEFTYRSTWTPHDAERAGLCTYAVDDRTGLWKVSARSKDNGLKPWEAYTPAMLRWRAIGDVAREGAEDVLLGIHYTPEELGGDINDAGEMVQVREPDTAAVDWSERLDQVTSKQQLIETINLAKNDARGDQYKGKVRTKALTLFGRFNTEQLVPDETIDAEIVPDEPDAQVAPDREPTEEEYEAMAAAEFAAAMERGEASS